MKRLVSLSFFTLLCSGVFAQLADTSTLQKRAIYKIGLIKPTATGLTAIMIRDALRADNDFAAIKTPYMDQASLRAGKADTAQVVHVIHPVNKRVYVFRYNPLDTTSPDDSATIIRSGSRRYEIQSTVYDPGMWGAIVNDNSDDYVAIQKMLNFIKARADLAKRSAVVFSSGIYDVSNTLTIKQSTGGAYYLSLEGSGEGRTTIRGIPGSIAGKDLISMPQTIYGVNSYFHIKDLTLSANGANRCFYSNRIIGAKFEDVMFYGGEDACLKIGTYGSSEGYSNYITRCYFNGITLNGGTNNALLQNHQTRFTIIRDIETDGGYYGIDILGSDKVSIVGGKIEGSKRAAIRIGGSYGSEARISDVYINPYIGDKNSQYDGTISGIEMALSFHAVTANRIFLPAVDTTARTLWNYTGLTGSMNYTNQVTGSVSGTTASLVGWNVSGGRVHFTSISGSGFIEGETITQTTTGATMVLGSRIQIQPAVGIRNLGNENTFTGNVITGEPNVGFLCTASTGTMLTGNYIFGTQIGLQASGTMSITGNRIYAPPGKSSFVRGFASVQGAGNDFGSGISTDWLTPTWSTGGGMTVKGTLNLYGGNGISIFGGDQTVPTTRTDVTTKTWILGLPHYTNSEEPPGMIYASSTSADNILRLGGGLSILNGMTRISLFTSPNITSATGTERMRVWNNGGVHIQPDGGTFTEVPAAALNVSSTTQGLLPPRMTTTQRDAISSPPEGLEIYNLTTHTKDYFNGTVWKVITTN